jgi:hypothetical protein
MTYSMPSPKTKSIDNSFRQTAVSLQPRKPARVLMFPAIAASGSQAYPDVCAPYSVHAEEAGCPPLGPVWPAQKPEGYNDRSKQSPPGASSPILDALYACRGVLRAVAGVGVAVHVSAESGLPAVALDDDSLERVLLQLVKNAVEAMPEGGVVHIAARRALSRSTPAVLVHVSDDGHGIPPLALEHIFKPGFTSKRNTRGWGEVCGLGLTLVRDLVQSAGGSIEVASRRRRGTTFELRIPWKDVSEVSLSSVR